MSIHVSRARGERCHTWTSVSLKNAARAINNWQSHNGVTTRVQCFRFMGSFQENIHSLSSPLLYPIINNKRDTASTRRTAQESFELRAKFPENKLAFSDFGFVKVKYIKISKTNWIFNPCYVYTKINFATFVAAGNFVQRTNFIKNLSCEILQTVLTSQRLLPKRKGFLIKFTI